MPLETATYPTDLVTSNPAASDGMNNADDHMRLTKAVIKNALAGVNAALTRAIASATAFGLIPSAGSSTEPSYSFAAEPTLGFYRSAAGVLAFTGGKMTGVLPVGGLHEFLVAPAGLGAGGTGTGFDYLELDGSTWPNASFPALATHLGQGGTTFTLPDAKTVGRFKRSRTATVAAGTVQANQNKAHTHTGSGNTGTASNDHTHPFSGNTGTESANHTHTTAGIPQISGPNNNTGGGGGSFAAMSSTNTTLTSGTQSAAHTHFFSGTTSGMSADHTHAFSFTSSSDGGPEARPEALSVIFCIKT